MSTRKRGREISCSPPPESTEGITRQLNSIHFPRKRHRESLEEVLDEGDHGRTEYTVNGKGQREGLYKSYFPNGQLREMANYDGGERFGVIQQWFPNGFPFELYTMKYGLRNGAAITWFSSGMIRCYENYKDGSLDGSCVYYNESGEKQIERIYSEGTVIDEDYYD